MDSMKQKMKGQSLSVLLLDSVLFRVLLQKLSMILSVTR